MKKNKIDNEKVKLVDVNRRNSIIEIFLEKDYNKALKLINYYIEEYPYDELARSIKTSTLRCLYRYEEALECLNTCENAKAKKLGSYIREKMYLFLCLERYEEAYELANTLSYEYLFCKPIDKELEKIIVSVEKILLSEEEFNTLYNYDDYRNKYIVKQIIKYDPEIAIEVAKSRENNNNANWKFSDEFDIDSKFYEIVDKLNTCVRLPSTILDDYFVYEPNCGTYENKKCDYLKVTTVKNTHNIVNIFPFPKSRVILQEQKNDDIEVEIEDTNYKKKNMIKRFNDRYNKKK